MEARTDRIPIRFETVALRQWTKIIVQKSLCLMNLRSLLANKYDSGFEHLRMRAFGVEVNGRNQVRLDLPVDTPIEQIPYFRVPQKEYRVILDFDYSGG